MLEQKWLTNFFFRNYKQIEKNHQHQKKIRIIKVQKKIQNFKTLPNRVQMILMTKRNQWYWKLKVFCSIILTKDLYSLLFGLYRLLQFWADKETKHKIQPIPQNLSPWEKDKAAGKVCMGLCFCCQVSQKMFSFFFSTHCM